MKLGRCSNNCSKKARFVWFLFSADSGRRRQDRRGANLNQFRSDSGQFWVKPGQHRSDLDPNWPTSVGFCRRCPEIAPQSVLASIFRALFEHLPSFLRRVQRGGIWRGFFEHLLSTPFARRWSICSALWVGLFRGSRFSGLLLAFGDTRQAPSDWHEIQQETFRNEGRAISRRAGVNSAQLQSDSAQRLPKPARTWPRLVDIGPHFVGDFDQVWADVGQIRSEFCGFWPNLPRSRSTLGANL